MQNNSVPDSVLDVGTAIGTMILGAGEGVDAETSLMIRYLQQGASLLS